MAEISTEDTITKDLRLRTPIKYLLELNLNLRYFRKKEQETQLLTSLTLTQLTEVCQRTKDISSNMLMDQDLFSENQEQAHQVPP